MKAIAVTGADDFRGPGLGPGVTFTDLLNVKYGPTGLVALRGQLAGGSANTGLFVGDASTLSATALSGDAALGISNANYSILVPSGFFSDGRLMFNADLAGSGVSSSDDAATYITGDSAPAFRKGQAAPGLFGVTAASNQPNQVSGNVPVFGIQLQGLGINASNDNIIYAGPALNQVLREGTGGANLNANEYYSGIPTLYYSRSGSVRFSSEIRESVGNTSVGFGLFAWNGSSVSTLARTNGPAAGNPTAVYSDNPNVQDSTKSGDLIFKSVLTGAGITSANDRVLVRAGDTGISLVAQTGDPVPSLPGQSFIDLAPFPNTAKLGRPGVAAFNGQWAVTGASSRGLFLERGGIETAIVLGGNTTLPGLQAGQSIRNPGASDQFMLSDNGAMVFTNFITNSGSRSGLWYYGLDNQYQFILRTGDLFDTDPTAGVDERIVASISLVADPSNGRSSAFVNDRQFDVFLNFSDGSKGLFQFTAVPEPNSLGLLLLSAISVFSRRSR
jgi:hypothetical protein